MKLKIDSSPEVQSKFENYPDIIKTKLLGLRKLIIEVAGETPEIKQMEETLKWGEPSYVVKKGSTIRIDWKEKAPNQYAMYFKCTSQLVPTFKKLFHQTFKFEGTRAIIFNLSDEIPVKELKKCIKAALTYHSIKEKPLLGLE